MEGVTALQGITTAAGESRVFSVSVHVIDGRLTLRAGGGGGGISGLTSLQFLVIAAEADVDEDGVANGSDNCPLTMNPSQTDADGDGLGDACDNCPSDHNVSQADSDGDGLGNVCDACALDPLNDADTDGVCGNVDNCPSTANAGQANSDGDALGNACDACPLDPLNDADTDGVCGNVDNCPSTANAGQANADGDALGDACDACALDPLNDADFDGVCGNLDNCPSTSNSSQTNTDGDGTGDACDLDDDNDGVPDAADNCPVTVNPGQQDRDGDGIGNLCDPLRINFQPCAAPPVAGYAIDCGEVVTEVRGYGWDVGVGTRDRNVESDQRKDTFAFTSTPRVWEAALPNADYLVKVVVGDASFPQGPHKVVVEGTTIFNNQVTAAGQHLEGSATVAVRDGRLTVEIGNGTSSTMIDYLEAIETAAQPVFLDSINFQPAGVPVPFGWTADTGSVFDSGTHRGWDLAVQSRKRNKSPDPLCDSLVFTSALRSWETPVPAPGFYEVVIGYGDPSNPQGPQKISVEGKALVVNATTVNQCARLHAVIHVTDGSLSLQAGNGGGFTALNFISIASATADADLDGIPNGSDNCPGNPNAGQQDTDGDGVGDACDVCPVVSNPAQADCDRDGAGDACEPDADSDAIPDDCDACPADPNNDVDADTICGNVDNCPTVANTNQVNADGDALGNACDACPLDPLNDVDADGVCGNLDNCPSVANPGQTDTDGDGDGNACETDDDNDGVPDASDNCPVTVNPGQQDRDGDGIGNLCDPLRINFQPCAAPPVAGYAIDCGEVATEARGYGWDVALETRDRNVESDQRTDTFAFTSTARIWEGSLPNADYLVKVVVGDASSPQGPHRVVVEGTTIFNNQMTAAGQHLEGSATVAVRDGRLTVEIGNGASNTAIDYLEAVETAAQPVFLDSINFQPAGAARPLRLDGRHGLRLRQRHTSWMGPRGAEPEAEQIPRSPLRQPCLHLRLAGVGDSCAGPGLLRCGDRLRRSLQSAGSPEDLGGRQGAGGECDDRQPVRQGPRGDPRDRWLPLPAGGGRRRKHLPQLREHHLRRQRRRPRWNSERLGQLPRHSQCGAAGRGRRRSGGPVRRLPRRLRPGPGRLRSGWNGGRLRAGRRFRLDSGRLRRLPGRRGQRLRRRLGVR